MNIKNIVLLLLSINIMVGALGQLAVYDYELGRTTDFDAITTNESFRSALNPNSTAVDESELSLWGIVSQTKELLAKVYSAAFGFPWLIDQAFGAVDGQGNITPVGYISNAMTGIMMFLYLWLIVEAVRGMRLG